MNRKLLSAAKILLFLGLGVGLLWWQYHGFNDQQRTDFLFGLRHANYLWFGVAVIIGALAHLSRALRWRMLLEPLGHKTRTGSLFFSVMIGYLANYALPRLGEVMRCGVLAREEKVPFQESFGTVIVERIIDMLCLLLVFLLTIIFEFRQLKALLDKYIFTPLSEKLAKLWHNPTGLIIAGVALLLIVTALFLLRKKIRALFTGKIGKVLKGFWEGIKAVRRVKRPGLFIAHTLFIWTGYLMSLYACFFCFAQTSTLSLNTALVLLLFGTFGVIFTPGGIGAYQIIVTSIMMEVSTVPLSTAAPFSWLSWGSQLITVLLFTAIAYGLLPVLNRQRHVKA